MIWSAQTTRCLQLNPIGQWIRRMQSDPSSKNSRVHCQGGDRDLPTSSFSPHTLKGRYRSDKRCRRCDREDALRTNYGLTLSAFRDLLERQGGRCPICLTALSASQARVDHNHLTHHVRGLLCARCNVMVAKVEQGYSKDTPSSAPARLWLERVESKRRPLRGAKNGNRKLRSPNKPL